MVEIEAAVTGGDAQGKATMLAAARRASRQARNAYERRDDAIVRAADYASYSEIAAAVGLSKPRVAKIVSDRRYEDGLRRVS